VGTANHDFSEDCVVSDMLTLHLDFQVRHRRHELLVKPADSVSALVVFAPRLVIVPCGISEGAENAFKVMLVLQSNVLCNDCDAN
jgi:hypothetical protein